MQTKKDSTIWTWTLIFFWPLISVLGLFLAANIFPPPSEELTYTDSLDHDFFVTLLNTAPAFVIAFCVAPSVVLIKNLITSKKLAIFFGIMGAATIYILNTFLDISDSLGRLDCGDGCVPTVMPEYPGSVLINLTTGLLIVTFLVFLLIALVQAHRNKKLNIS